MHRLNGDCHCSSRPAQTARQTEKCDALCRSWRFFGEFSAIRNGFSAIAPNLHTNTFPLPSIWFESVWLVQCQAVEPNLRIAIFGAAIVYIKLAKCLATFLFQISSEEPRLAALAGISGMPIDRLQSIARTEQIRAGTFKVAWQCDALFDLLGETRRDLRSA